MDCQKVILKYTQLGRRRMKRIGRGGKTVELERPEGLYLEVIDESNHF
jgi:hypothetical protein